MGFEALLGGAAAAAGPAPTDVGGYSKWLTRVSTIAADLQRLSEATELHEGRKRECISLETDGTKKRFYGKLVNAKKIVKGSGEKTVTKGYLQFEARDDAHNVDEDGYEFIETAPLTTPEGSFEFERAMSLVGQNVIIYKRLIPLQGGKKARECAAIDPADTFRDATGTQIAEPVSAPLTPTAPAPSVPRDSDTPNTPAPSSDPVDFDAALRKAEEVFEKPKETSVADTPPPSGATTNISALLELAPESEEELVALAQEHLGKSANDVRAVMVEMYNVPAGKKLPSRQYASVWQEMVGK